MRKLLLGTTALAAAATLTANTALAELAISGYIEWDYSNVSSNLTANDGNKFGQDSEIKFSFTNKTDSGLTVGFVAELETEKAGAADNQTDDAYMYIEGGFGKFVLGELDGVMDQYGIASSDLPAEEIYAGGGSVSTEAGDGVVSGGEANKVSYHLPAIGGLKAGASYTNSGLAGSADSTAYAASYSVDAGGAAVTIAGVTGTKEVSGAQDEDTTSLGIKIAAGNATFVLSNATYEDADQNESTNGAAASFKMSDTTTLVGYTTKLEDDLSNEEYTLTGVEVQYTIASGLQAVINVEDYEYFVSAGSASNDSGTASSLTLKATF